jgi:hypothetical protein
MQFHSLFMGAAHYGSELATLHVMFLAAPASVPKRNQEILNSVKWNGRKENSMEQLWDL